MTKMCGSTPKPWVKLWRDERGSFAGLPLFARALAAEILKLTDAHGVIHTGSRPHADYIAFALGADRSDRRLLQKYLPVLEADGYLRCEAGRIVICSWSRWQLDPRASHEAATTEQRSDHEAATKLPRPSNEEEAKSAETLAPKIQEGEEDKDVEEEIEQAGAAAPLFLSLLGEKTDPIGDLFEHWQCAVGARRAKLDAKRRKRLKWALANFSLEDCKRACIGLALSDFHMGRDPKTRGVKYCDVSNVFRDAAQVEKWIEVAASGRRVGSATSGRLPPEDGEGWSEDDIPADDGEREVVGYG